MIKASNAWMMAGAAALFLLGTGDLLAQGRGFGRGNFDPQEMRQRIMERYKEALEVTNDAEWKLLEARIEKVMEARRDVGFGGRGFFGRRPGGEEDRNRRGGPDREREVNPETEALQKAIDAKAPADEIKAKLAKYRDARKQREAALETARQDLRKVLSMRQEAIAVMMGLLE